MTVVAGIIDAHVHVASPDVAGYPRNQDFPRAPALTGTIEEFHAVAGPLGVTRGVLIQPSQYGFDHAYLRESLRRRPGCVGVALADPGDPHAATTLTELTRSAPVTGIRLGPNFGDGRDWFGPGAGRIADCARDLGLAVSLFIRPAHLPAAEQWLSGHPGLAVVIDHLGRPDLGDGKPLDAVRALGRLARFPGVYVKVSALPAMSRTPYPHTDTWPWARTAADAFGVGRLMWGSDFPLTASGKSYARGLEVISRAMDHLSERDLGQLLAGTAREVYRLPEERDHAHSH